MTHCPAPHVVKPTCSRITLCGDRKKIAANNLRNRMSNFGSFVKGVPHSEMVEFVVHSSSNIPTREPDKIL